MSQKIENFKPTHVCIKKISTGRAYPIIIEKDEKVRWVKVAGLMAYETEEGRYVFPRLWSDNFEEI